MYEWILLENRQSIEEPALFFENSVGEIIAWEASALNQSFELIRYYQKKGYYIVGFLSFELGYIFQNLVRPTTMEVPLLHFKVYQKYTLMHAQVIEQRLFSQSTVEAINTLRLNWNFVQYQQAFDQVKQFIINGDSYQVNLTSKYHFNFEEKPIALYRALRERQKVPYSGFLNWNDYQILTLSPELFFIKQGARLTVKPMKGTIKRGCTTNEDLQHKIWLTQDTKSKAENTMIVDLLRNDLAMISHAGSVNVSTLLAVESYETVHQMVSTIESQVDRQIDFEQLIRALFPCGSITGAPKRRTIEIIRSVEAEPRGIYTGAIGYIKPNNDMCFNVAIRTIILKNGRGELGVGGGIVYDSNVLSEYEELKLKAQFFTDLSYL